jgi:hypothetical protein
VSADAGVRLGSRIVCHISSVAIDRAFHELLGDNENVGSAKRTLTAINRLFGNCDASAFEIWARLPLIAVGDILGVKNMSGFAFSFMVRLDVVRLKRTDMPFVLLRLWNSSKWFIELFLTKSTLVFRYESNLFRTPVIRSGRLPSNRWTLVTSRFTIDTRQNIVIFRYGNEISDQIDFRTIVFSDIVHGQLGSHAAGLFWSGNSRQFSGQVWPHFWSNCRDDFSGPALEEFLRSLAFCVNCFYK